MRKIIKAAFICLLVTIATVPPAIATNPILEAFESTWRVTSLYGPRWLNQSGSLFHKGIDFAPGSPGGAMGYMIKSRSAGKIVDFRYAAGVGGWMLFIQPTPDIQASHQANNIVYMHLFQNDGTVPAIKSSAEGYTKVQVVYVAKKLNNPKWPGQTNYCDAIAFWTDGVLSKVLTKKACEGGIYGNHTDVPADSIVFRGEEIAPIGNSFSTGRTVGAHLHLTMNHPTQNNPFYVVQPTVGSGSNNTIFYKNPNDTTKLLSDKGFWFDIATGGNLSLNSVSLLLKLANGTNIPLENAFNFGGAPREDGKNTKVILTGDANCTSMPNGYYTYAVNQGCSWNGTPSPKKFRFFYPYDVVSLPSGTHQVCLTAKDVSGNSILFDECTSFIPSSSCENPKIGDKCHGGIVFYVDESGKHGLVASPNDLGFFSWSDIDEKETLLITGATGNGVGAGAANTKQIIAVQGAGRYAAMAARNYDGGGYSDWYLPSINELFLLLQQREIIGGFPVEIIDPLYPDFNFYYSSTEHSDIDAWVISFPDGVLALNYKRFGSVVRAIRAF